MSELDPKNTDGNDEPGGSAGNRVAEQTVPHAPGGPGWIAEHSLYFWVGGVVLVISALVIYMIFDN